MFGGMGGNMAGMMKKMQKLQTQMKLMQSEIKKRTVEAAVDPDDIEMLQDLIVSAVNECSKKADEMTAAEMSKLTSGLGLPPGMI